MISRVVETEGIHYEKLGGGITLVTFFTRRGQETDVDFATSENSSDDGDYFGGKFEVMCLSDTPIQV